jgi:ABC-type hemin transport system ATPase subunit
MWRGLFGLSIEEGVTMIVTFTIQQRMMSLVRWLLAKEEASSLDTAFWHDLIKMLSHCETPNEFAHCLQEEILSYLNNARCYADDTQLLIEQRVEVVLANVETLSALREVYQRVQEELTR